MEGRYKDRKRSYIVKMLLKESKYSLEDVSYVVGCNVPYFNNKLARNSWSFEDILAVALASGYEMTFERRSDDKEQKRIDPSEYIPEAVDRMHDIEMKRRAAAYEEYLKAKKELNSMKELYGFED